jgi:DNA-directed RNA polymerase subunit RPC12/RpoP
VDETLDNLVVVGRDAEAEKRLHPDTGCSAVNAGPEVDDTSSQDTNLGKGRAMRLGQAEYARLEQDFVAKARGAFRAVFDAEEQEELITLTQREERVLQKGAELQGWLLEEHLKHDPLADPAEAEAIRCPKCRTLGVRAKGAAQDVPREIKTRAGTQVLARTKYRCPSCRKVFFPLGRALAAGAGGLQSGAGAQDRAAGRQG